MEKLMENKGEKLIIEWLFMLKEPYRSKSLHNYYEQGRDKFTATSFKDALEKAFWWACTDIDEEGYSFWREIYKSPEEYMQEFMNPSPSQKKEPFPRRVMVKRLRSSEWEEAELLADLSAFGIIEDNYPYMFRSEWCDDDYDFAEQIMEIEDYEKKFGPVRFGVFVREFFENNPSADCDLDLAYAAYEERLELSRQNKNKEA